MGQHHPCAGENAAAPESGGGPTEDEGERILRAPADCCSERLKDDCDKEGPFQGEELVAFAVDELKGAQLARYG
jgi:hypothetical protein